MEDLTFTSSDLENGKIFVSGLNAGDICVIDENGNLVIADQQNYTKDEVEGVLVDLSSFTIPSGVYWTIHQVGSVESSSSSSSSDSSDSSSSSSSLIHNFIKPISTGVSMIDTIVNEMIYPQMWMFCEIMAHYEVGSKSSDGNYHFTYHHWNTAYPPQVFLNGSDIPLDSSQYEVNYEEGIIIPKFTTTAGDNVICTYNFTWFTDETMASYVRRSIGTVNFYGTGSTTQYTEEDFPEYFYGISADLCIAMMCESLILSQTMWYGKLIFSFSGNDLYNGSSDIQSQLETIKRNCEDRAYGQLNNEKTRAPNAIARPSPAYWRAVTMGTGVRYGIHGKPYGKTKGIKINKLQGMAGVNGVDLGV